MVFSLNKIYGDSVGESLFSNVKSGLQELYDDYSTYINPPSQASSQFGILSDTSEAASADTGNSMSLLKVIFKKHKINLGFGGSKKTDLDIYLSETVIEDDRPFDILRWWKINADRFSILSILARDVLIVPISTMASESAFSIGGRVLDCFRSSLTPKLVEALICSQDWLRKSGNPVSVEEALDEVENFEKGNFWKFLILHSSISFFMLLHLYKLNLNRFLFRFSPNWILLTNGIIKCNLDRSSVILN